MSKAFSSFQFTTGKLADLDRKFPSYLSAWDRRGLDIYDSGSTHFGYVHEGDAVLRFEGMVFRLKPGMYFAVPGPCSIDGGRGIAVSREGYRGMFVLGGPAEQRGRLRYIDGCTDSLLIPPVMLGDPCLNLLYFPPGIDQTAHTHPSDRIGMIMSGRGRCHFWDGGEHERTIDLEAGMIFCIHAEGMHKFSTPYGEEMRVLAYHPDSDFGPTHEEHPMLNRTIVNGVSARFIDAIRTRE